MQLNYVAKKRDNSYDYVCLVSEIGILFLYHHSATDGTQIFIEIFCCCVVKSYSFDMCSVHID